VSDLLMILGGILAGLGALAAALAAAFWRGRGAERTRRDAQDAADYRDTRQRMDDAIADDPGPDHVRDWLRQRADEPRRRL
jgi:hypothetical protein